MYKLTEIYRLSADGNVIVIEHNLDVIKTGYYRHRTRGWRQGTVVATKNSEEIVLKSGMHTGKYIDTILKKFKLKTHLLNLLYYNRPRYMYNEKMNRYKCSEEKSDVS